MSGALGIVAALTLSAPSALADPAPAAPAPAPVDPTISATGPTPGPAPDGTVQATGGELAAPPDGMPHLSSPENLPPGTTDTPPDGTQRPLGYLRDIWQAYQTQEVSGRDALLLFLSQRPMNANPAPWQGLPANPTPPVPAALAAPAPSEPAAPVPPEPALPLLPAPAP